MHGVVALALGALMVVAQPVGTTSGVQAADVGTGDPPVSLAGADYRFDTSGSTPYLEEWFDHTWLRLAVLPPDASHLTAFEHKIYVVGDAADGLPTAEEMSDGIFQPVSPTLGAVDRLFTFQDQLFAAGSGGWWSSSDGGTWSTVPSAPSLTTDPVELSGVLIFDATTDGLPADAQFTQFDGAHFTTPAGGPAAMISPAVANGVLYYRASTPYNSDEIRTWDGARSSPVQSTFSATAGPVVAHGKVYAAGFFSGPFFMPPHDLVLVDANSIRDAGGYPDATSELYSVDDVLWYHTGAAGVPDSGWTQFRERLPYTASEAVITGSPVAFASLHAQVSGTWPTTTTFTYQWQRDGQPIQGATAADYDTDLSDEYHRISVSVTAVTPDYEPQLEPVRSDQAVSIEAPDFRRAVRPWISGTMRAGRLVRAVVPAWTPAAAHFYYSWQRDGRNIPNEVRSTYRLRRSDIGHAITATVVGSVAHYDEAIRTSHARIAKR